MNTRRTAIIINAAFFQAVWLASVLGAARGLPWLGPVAFAGFAAWQLRRTDEPEADLYALAAFGTAGLVVDSLWPLADAVRYASPWPLAELTPVWLLVMWLNLGLTVNHSLAWLKGRLWLSVPFAAVGGGLAYWTGMKLGAVEFLAPAPVLVGVIALAWALVFPLLLALVERLRLKETTQ